MQNFERVLAIGDVHGKFNKLNSLWNKIGFNPSNDFLIFLGDYIDRGGQPMKCLNFVRFLAEKYENVHALMGNHEDMMNNYFKSHTLDDEADLRDIWLDPCNGGIKTLSQLQKSKKNAAQLVEFAKNLPVYYTGIDGFLFVHGGADSDLPLKKQDPEEMVWMREEGYEFYDDMETTMVIGHTPVQYINRNRNFPIVRDNNVIMLDTGSYFPNGKISCMDVLNKKVWQSD